MQQDYLLYKTRHYNSLYIAVTVEDYKELSTGLLLKGVCKYIADPGLSGILSLTGLQEIPFDIGQLVPGVLHIAVQRKYALGISGQGHIIKARDLGWGHLHGYSHIGSVLKLIFLSTEG